MDNLSPVEGVVGYSVHTEGLELVFSGFGAVVLTVFQRSFLGLSMTRRWSYWLEFGWGGLGEISNLGRRGRGMRNATLGLPRMSSVPGRSLCLLGSSDFFHSKVEVGSYGCGRDSKSNTENRDQDRRKTVCVRLKVDVI